MSDRERAINIIDSLPDSQVYYVLHILQNFKAALDENADDEFCERIYADYVADDDDDKNDGIIIENFAESLGIEL